MRAFGDAAFERIIQLHQRLLRFDSFGQVAARFILPRARPQRRRHCAPQRLRVQRTFEHDHVAKPFEHFQPARGAVPDARRGEQGEREIGPCRLLVEPREQPRRKLARERFLGDQRRARAGVERGGERIGIAACHAHALVLMQDFGNHIGVAAERRQDENALLHDLTAWTCR